MPSRESIDRKHHEAHSGFYLTLVSIMQGLALGFLLQTMATELATTGGLSILSLVQFVACLAVLIIVWHEYAIGVVLFRWRLDMADSTIPFLFGISEYAMIEAIAIPASGHDLSSFRFSIFLWSFPVFCAISCLAYWNQSSKAVIDEDCRDMITVSKSNKIQALWTAVAFGVIAGIQQFFQFGQVGQVAIGCVIAVSLIGHCIRINHAYDKGCLQTEGEPQR